MPHKKKVVFDRDNPEWTEKDFKRAQRFVKGTKLQDAAEAIVRRRGRPPSENPKVAIKLRLDAEVLESYRSTGDGWQTRINADLRKIRKLG